MKLLEHDNPRRVQRLCLIVAAAGVAVAIVLGLFSGGVFFHGYLFAFMLWLALPLGALAILMLHHLSGGRWGWSVRRLLEAMTLTVPLAAVLFVPILLGMTQLYPWTHEPEHPEPTAWFRSGYLESWFFILRAIVFFVAWSLLALVIGRWSLRQHRDASVTARLGPLAAGGAVLHVFMMSFAGIDWIGSLEEHWYSSIFGLYVIVGQALTAMAVVALVAAWVAWEIEGAGATPPQLRSGGLGGGEGGGGGGAGAGVLTRDHLHDLGNLLLALVVLHAYIGFSQFFIIWNGNLPHAVSWYVPRTRGVWAIFAGLIMLLHFFLPFAALLFRQVKRDPRKLIWIAALVLAARVIDTAWMVLPSADGLGVLGALLAVVLAAALGALWLAALLWQWQRVTREVLDVG